MSQAHDKEDLASLFEQVLADYLRAEAAGTPLKREELLSAHSDLADELRSYFANRDALERLAAPLKAAGDAPTLSHNSASETSTQQRPRVRYFGDYELQEEIARGGMGVVYRARQVTLNRPVALKMILAGNLAAESDVQRFYAEAEAAANLDHPNIVPIYEVGEHDGQHYFSMKVIEGGSLREHLPRFQTDRRAAAQLMVVVARAIHHAHQRGVLHRDLKPSNILLDASGQPHVTDFGLARRIEGGSDLTCSGAIVGTPSYMPPEQARAEKQLSTAVDIYSLGAILYELLAGRAPFRAESPMETLLAVISRDPDRPSSVAPNVDRDLETICLKCLEKDPENRYASAAALADDLERWQRGEPIQARASSLLERARKWARRRPASAGLIVTSGVALLALVGGLVHFINNLTLQKTNTQLQVALQEAGVQRARAEELDKFRRRTLYASRINLAQQYWKKADVGRTLQILESLRPIAGQDDPRGFEWYYLWRLCHNAHHTLVGHDHAVNVIAFSPDGKTLAVGDGWVESGDARLWSVSSGELQAQLKIGDWVKGLTFSPDGITLATASGSYPSDVILWEVATRTQQFKFQSHDSTSAQCLTFSPDGKTLAVGNMDGTICLWDVPTRRELTVLKGHNGWVLSLAFSRDGQLTSGDTEGLVIVWDVSAKKELFRVEGHEGWVSAVAFAPDGKTLASASLDGTVRLWDPQTGTPRDKLMADAEGVWSIAFAPDGATLASGGEDRTVRLWDLAKGQVRQVIRGHSQGVSAVAFSPSGKTLATGSNDCSVKLWDVGTEQEFHSLERKRPMVRSVAFAGDGQTLVAESDVLEFWDFASMRLQTPRHNKMGEFGRAAISNDGRVVALERGDQSVALWDVVTGVELARLKKQIHPIFAPNGKLMATLSAPNTVELWDGQTGEHRFTFPIEKAEIRSIAFTPDGLFLATGGKDARLQLWNLNSGKEGTTLPQEYVNIEQLSFSPAGTTLATVAMDGTIRLLDVTTGQEQATIQGGHSGTVTCIAFSPDGNTLASGSAGGGYYTFGEVKLWDIVTGQELLTLDNQSSAVRSVAFSRDGRWLASGGGDGDFGQPHLKLWHAPASPP